MASLRGDFLDGATHVPVAVKRELHDATPTAASNSAA